jgi:hypothetical protein
MKDEGGKMDERVLTSGLSGKGAILRVPRELVRLIVGGGRGRSHCSDVEGG